MNINIASFFCEEIIQLMLRKPEICAIKAGGIPCDGKVQMDPILPDLGIPRRILQAEVDESPNKHFSLVQSHINDMYFCKSAQKMAKFETLGAFGGQVPSPKSFKCG
jgi:hypothetical protein